MAPSVLERLLGVVSVRVGLCSLPSLLPGRTAGFCVVLSHWIKAYQSVQGSSWLTDAVSLWIAWVCRTVVAGAGRLATLCVCNGPVLQCTRPCRVAEFCERCHRRFCLVLLSCTSRQIGAPVPTQTSFAGMRAVQGAVITCSTQPLTACTATTGHPRQCSGAVRCERPHTPTESC